MTRKSKTKRDVQIKAQNVTVANNNSRKQQHPNNNKQRNNSKASNPADDLSPVGIQTGLAHLGAGGPLPVPPCEFAKLYCDPCGEHTNSLDAARVPDGAFQVSVGGYPRFIDTIVFPWQQSGNTAVSGNDMSKTYSMLFLQLPLLRNLMVILARENDGEFSDAILNKFALEWASADKSLATYPNWLIADNDTLTYYTVIDTAALRNISPPSVNGVSGTIDSYRFTSQGFNLMFNTPTLLDQGTVTSMRYPTNADTKTFELPTAELGIGVTTHPSYRVASVNPLVRSFAAPAVTLGGQIILASIAGIPTTNLPGGRGSPIPNGWRVRTAGGALLAVQGQSLEYRLSPTNAQIVQIVNVNDTGRFIDVLNMVGTQLGDQGTTSTRFYVDNDSDTAFPEGVVADNEVTVIPFPPVTQGDMMQANPKCFTSLCKESGGVYLPGCIFEPVFNVTPSTNYRKVLLLTDTTDLSEEAFTEYDPRFGWWDTCDKNFGISVANFQGIPYACKPMLKVSRSLEILPASHSVLGLFSTGTGDRYLEAVDFCFNFTDHQPHGFPSRYNGLGILFGMVMKAMTYLPTMLRTGRNIYSLVRNTVNSAEYKDIKGTLHRGFTPAAA